MAARRDELQDEITAGEVARQGDALRTAILDSVSHDLRTPLATIRAVAGGLLDPAAPRSEDATRSAAGAIDEEAERLGDLVRGLLDMSRIQAGAVHPDVAAYDLAELVETSIRRVGRGEAAARIGVAIADDLPPVTVDAVLFDVAFSNVLDNALRYAPPPSPIVVAADAADGARVALHVDDGGPGVPDEALGQLFDRFYRVSPSSERSRHGLGMGLAIARGFVAAMGGAIEASPSALGGLRVTMVLPAAALPGDEALAVAEPDTAGHRTEGRS
jgi:two-component system sensor histidine kinase KdpD